jgi:hypothetical protein
MKKFLQAWGGAFALAAVLSACGGGGGSDAPSKPVEKVPTIAFYGNALVHAAVVQGAAHADVTASDGTAASAPVADAPTTASDAAATVQTLTDALAAQGVTANVTQAVMDGTTLHTLVMSVDGGKSPTADQYTTVDQTEWTIVNFQLDDMVTSDLDPVQQAAIQQFTRDLIVFVQRQYVAGKRTFVVMPLPTCEANNQYTASSGLTEGIGNASSTVLFYDTGVINNDVSFDANGVPTYTLASHMGADCRTPDAYLQNLRTTAIATDIATRLKLVGNGI